MDSSGNYVVVWEDGRSGNADTYAKVYNADGSVRVNEFRVHAANVNQQDWSNVAMSDNGNFVVTWSDNRSGNYEVYMRLFNVNGTALTGESLVSVGAGVEDAHAVDFAADGSFVITWQNADINNGDIYFQRYNSSGVAQGGNTRANTYTTDVQNHPDVAVHDDGSFVITWMSNGQDGNQNGMYFQRFNASGVAQGAVTRINQTTTGEQYYGTVDSDASGNFVTTWMSDDGNGYGIYARRFDASGTALSNEFLVNTHITGDQGSPNVAVDADGDFIITWHDSSGKDGTGLGVYAQQFDSAGMQSGSDGSTIRGLNIQGFGTSGITVVSSNNTIVGNYIGTNAAGTAAAGNFDGINIWSGDNNIIGGTGANDRNVISGQTNNGIVVSGGADNTQILNNYVGLNAAGTAAIANGIYGIWAGDSVGLTIGGTSASQRNVVSGNGNVGISLSNVDNSIIYGNYVGTNAAGTGDINGTGSDTSKSGIILVNGSSGNQIGNTSLVGARNVISGNNHYGVEIQGLTSTNNTVVGNFIGTDITGLAALGNTNGGFSFWGSGTGNLLGGNVISGNLCIGVLVGSSASGSQIQGNYVGVGVDGSTLVGNGSTGIFVGSSGVNTLIGTNADGTNDVAEANTVSGNADGIVISDAGTTGTMIYGNYIGTTANGLVSRGNTWDGIRVANGATGTLIGGTGTARRNIIAGNGQDGVHIDGEATDGNTIQNNWIGLAADGVTVLGNGGDGIYISGGADNTVIGGIGLGNVIMGARVAGIEIDGASTGTSILGNLIGINAAGTVIHGSWENGILLENGAASTTIGGTTAGQGNTIVDSGRLSTTWQSGIGLTSTAGSSNSIIGNSIYNNRGLGIDLGATGATANDSLDADSGVNTLQKIPS